MKTFIIIGFSIIFSIIFIIGLIAFLTITLDKSQDKAKTNIDYKITDYKLLDNIKFHSIMKDFHLNEINAKKKYIGKKYRITEEINDIISGWNEIEFYIPKDDINIIEDYYFYCKFDNKEDLLKVKVGDKITILGTLDYIGGFEYEYPILNNKLVNCEIFMLEK